MPSALKRCISGDGVEAVIVLRPINRSRGETWKRNTRIPFLKPVLVEGSTLGFGAELLNLLSQFGKLEFRFGQDVLVVSHP